jgi:hypothetical protein
MSILSIFCRHGVELYFACVAALGAKWARPFVTDWTKALEMEIDFILIYQSWLVCPLILLTQVIGSPITQGGLRRIVVPALIMLEITALGVLINWKRSGLFARSSFVVGFFRFFPLVFIVAKVLLEFQPAS